MNEGICLRNYLQIHLILENFICTYVMWNTSLKVCITWKERERTQYQKAKTDKVKLTLTVAVTEDNWLAFNVYFLVGFLLNFAQYQSFPLTILQIDRRRWLYEFQTITNKIKMDKSKRNKIWDT